MSLLGDIGEPNNNSRETDLHRFIFAQVQDNECGTIGWRLREDEYGVSTETIRLFDTVQEVLAEGIKDMIALETGTEDLSTHLQVVQDNLLEAVGSLTLAHHLLENTGLSKRYSALFTAVCDALNATSAAIEHCDDQPDQ
jgi:hypothetical protein